MSLVPWPLWCPYLSLSWPWVVNQSTYILNRWSGSWFPVMFPATCELHIGTQWYHVDEGIPNNKLTWYYNMCICVNINIYIYMIYQLYYIYTIYISTQFHQSLVVFQVVQVVPYGLFRLSVIQPLGLKACAGFWWIMYISSSWRSLLLEGLYRRTGWRGIQHPRCSHWLGKSVQRKQKRRNGALFNQNSLKENCSACNIYKYYVQRSAHGLACSWGLCPQ